MSVSEKESHDFRVKREEGRTELANLGGRIADCDGCVSFQRKDG